MSPKPRRSPLKRFFILSNPDRYAFETMFPELSTYAEPEACPEAASIHVLNRLEQVDYWIEAHQQTRPEQGAYFSPCRYYMTQAAQQN